MQGKDVKDILQFDYESKLRSILQKFDNVDASQLLQSLCLRTDSAGEVLGELDKISELQINKALQIQDKIIAQVVDYKRDAADVDTALQDGEDDRELVDAITGFQDRDTLDFQKPMS